MNRISELAVSAKAEVTSENRGRLIAMTTPDGTDIFYGSIPVFRGFGSLMDPAMYSPLPDDWTVGVADIVESTKAIANQRYKAVNMAGAAVIAAVTNALDGREFPFVFGGDGASFAVSPATSRAPATRWRRPRHGSAQDLDLVMRVALVPVRDIRAQGLDIRVARFGPSANLSYAMFSGGGSGVGGCRDEAGEFAVPAAAPGTQPDLSGLSCRFEEIPSTRGLILSVLVVPAKGRRSARIPQGDRGHHQAGRTSPGCRAAGAAGRAAAALAAGRRGV